jgi:uncharacterized protein
MNILVSGASGLIGRPVCDALRKRGHTVRTLSRQHGDVIWHIEQGYIDSSAFDGINCVIHLAGENIAQRWSAAARARIVQSRLATTRLLMSEIARHGRKIDFICASGINFYGYDRADKLTEESPSGSGFLAELCCRWEGAVTGSAVAELLAETKFIRTGVVLTPEGGALKKILPIFKAGLGGRLGSGLQMMSWISLADLARIYVRSVEDNTLTGAVNAVAPKNVSNAEFTRALSAALHRPACLPVPAIALKIFFGEMAKETVLANLQVLPQKLQQTRFEWKHPDITTALKTMPL